MKYTKEQLEVKIKAGDYAETPEQFIKDLKDSFDVAYNEYAEEAMGKAFFDSSVSTAYNYTNILNRFEENAELLFKEIQETVQITLATNDITFPVDTPVLETGSKIHTEDSTQLSASCCYWIRNNTGQSYFVYPTKQDALDNTNAIVFTADETITVLAEV